MLWKTDLKPSCSFCDHTVRDRTMELANKNRILLIKQNSFGENDNLFFSFKGEHSRGARTLMHRTNCASLCKHSLPPSLPRSLAAPKQFSHVKAVAAKSRRGRKRHCESRHLPQNIKPNNFYVFSVLQILST